MTQYRVRDGGLPAGSTLGAPKAVAVIKATGALEKLYSCEAGADAFGSVLVRHWDRRSGIELQARTGHFLIAFERQEHTVEHSLQISSRERIFLLSTLPRDGNLRAVDPPALYYDVLLRNAGDETAELRTDAAVRLARPTGESVAARFDDEINAFVMHAGERPEFVRIAAATKTPVGHEITNDRVGIFRFEHSIEPGHTAGFTIVLTFSINGEATARANLNSLPDCDEALTRTQKYYCSTIGRAAVMTPEPEVNAGVQWAKANIARSLLLAPQGWCIVNDPAQTTHSVGRDTAWFALGAGYVVPWFAAESLRWFLDHLTEAGMAVEWYDSCSGNTETDGLDVNDNTPLLLWAVWHHFCVSGDRSFLESVYHNVLRAARCIVSKRGANGLVWCHAPGTGAHGIVGWRNALRGRRLSGATTELNCECYAALRAAASIATTLADAGSAETFARQAEELRAAINAHLLDRSRNLYYLAIDEEGFRRTEVLSDLVFPLLFGVAEGEVAAKIVETLSRPEFWSDAGLHTAPRNAIDYSPGEGAGLLGGVWAAPTFWLATAAAAFNAELMVEALTATFRHYARDPLRYNTVPGQFCEWLHGETLTNGGMMLSPWFAPKYLWAAIEGAAALDVTAEPPTLHRRLPPAWSWLAARNVMVRGCEISWFSVRMERVTTFLASEQRAIEADWYFDADVTADVTLRGDEAVCVALRRAGLVTVFVGNVSERGIATSVSVAPACLPENPSLRVYDSVAGEWIERLAAEHGAGGLTVHVGRQGFCIVEFAKEGQ